MEASLNGRIFYNLDRLCNNFRLFLKRRTNAIDTIFLIFYVLLQLMLVFAIYFAKSYIEIIVGVFIILFLFLITLERIVLNFKSKQAQESKDDIERQYYELKNENKNLRDKNKELIERAKFLLDSLSKKD